MQVENLLLVELCHLVQSCEWVLLGGSGLTQFDNQRFLLFELLAQCLYSCRVNHLSILPVLTLSTFFFPRVELLQLLILPHELLVQIQQLHSRPFNHWCQYGHVLVLSLVRLELLDKLLELSLLDYDNLP
jgi:hypothetical protein